MRRVLRRLSLDTSAAITELRSGGGHAELKGRSYVMLVGDADKETHEVVRQIRAW